MILLVHGFTFAVGLAVLILLIVAVTAIWERLRGEKPELHSAPASASDHRRGKGWADGGKNRATT
jgi:hypothetical protein